jgi:hypothetical protein
MSAAIPRANKGRPGKPGALGRLAAGARGRLGRGRGMPHRRRRGISATELRGFRKVVRLLARVGMTPKKLRGAHPRRSS